MIRLFDLRFTFGADTKTPSSACRIRKALLRNEKKIVQCLLYNHGKVHEFHLLMNSSTSRDIKENKRPTKGR